MPTTIKKISLARHADLTDELKRGCRDTYNLNLYNHNRDRGMALPGTHVMDGEILAASVGFLTMNTLNYAAQVNSYSPVRHGFWGRLLGDHRAQEQEAHSRALMDLRRLLAEQDSLPWREDRVHFWQELDRMYQRFDKVDRQEMDDFFELLMGRTYPHLMMYHYVNIENAALLPGHIDLEQPQYITSPFLTGSIREDCALSLFSLAAGPQKSEGSNAPPNTTTSTTSTTSTTDYDDWDPDWYGDKSSADSSDGDDGLSDPETPLYPELHPFTIMNLGARLLSLEQALDLAFSFSLHNHYTKHIHIRFMGSTLLIGTRGPRSFSIDRLEALSDIGVNLSKTDILEAVKVAEAKAGFSTKMDDFLSMELGL